MTAKPQSVMLVMNAPAVVSETIAGETIIMHHGTGHYFDTSGAGTTLWEAIEAGGADMATLTAMLIERHRAGPTEAAAAAERFAALLGQHDLVRTAPAREDPPAAGPVCGTEPFEEPVLGVHTDLADMLLLDPIHDVGEAGWPAMPFPAANPATP